MGTELTTAEKRREISKIAMGMITRNASRKLPYTNAENRSPVVVALQEDKFSDVVEWTSSTGGANVLVWHGSVLKVLSFDPKGDGTSGDEKSESVPIHPDSEFGMVLDWLSRHPDKSAVVAVTSESGIEVPQPKTLQAA